MNNLIDKLEQADGPDRELDAEIARGIGWGCVMQDPQADHEWICWHERYRCGSWIVLPNYTASIDAAMTLVPEGWNKAMLIEDGEPVLVGLQLGKRGEYAEAEGKARTLPLALAAAALRAGRLIVKDEAHDR